MLTNLSWSQCQTWNKSKWLKNQYFLTVVKKKYQYQQAKSAIFAIFPFFSPQISSLCSPSMEKRMKSKLKKIAWTILVVSARSCRGAKKIFSGSRGAKNFIAATVAAQTKLITVGRPASKNFCCGGGGANNFFATAHEVKNLAALQHPTISSPWW